MRGLAARFPLSVASFVGSVRLAMAEAELPALIEGTVTNKNAKKK